jgi:outer membrane immunogenic protein
MKVKFLSGVSVLASFAMSMGAAAAADLGARPVPVYKAAPVIVSDWSGLYVGINAGGGWGDLTAPGLDLKTSGGVIGGQLGYNWQFGHFVVGVETDLDAANIKGTAFGTEFKTDELGSVRGRAGYAFLPNLLAYGTAGYAYGRTTFQGVDLFQDGWIAGAGLEYKVWGPLIARVEYLHYGIEGGVGGGTTLKNDIDVVRGGLSYKF